MSPSSLLPAHGCGGGRQWLMSATGEEGAPTSTTAALRRRREKWRMCTLYCPPPLSPLPPAPGSSSPSATGQERSGMRH
ncbi:Os06g0483301 [Oryza sativa Japonica Group]|uniref:Os06g0483301 protein n=1 Tax=Oryza sativa subsp. japonica TaxID=39947 RepID=A0A0P0WX63_ORYSJ|nr:hypothetical protein EE612_034202 [Oryza sativa]BAS97814.1 Os06g0483301 [Oryza sativa Japonica Group]